MKSLQRIVKVLSEAVNVYVIPLSFVLHMRNRPIGLSARLGSPAVSIDELKVLKVSFHKK